MKYISIVFNTCPDAFIFLIDVFYDNDKKVKATHFGFAVIGEGGKRYGSTYIDHKNDTVKEAWIKRHQINGTFEDYISASSLARYILWNKKTLRESIAEYKHRLNLE